MLQAIHDKAKGWVAYAIVAFISVPFALWGINSYLDGGSTLAAAVVNGEEIPARDVQNQLLQIRQQLGRMAAGMGDDALKQMALDNAVNQELLRQTATNEGYRASNKEVSDVIVGIPAFQTDGQFDPQKYQAYLQMQRQSQALFEGKMREDLTQEQFRKGVSDTAFVTQAQAQQYQSLRNQTREIETFTLKVADFEPQVQVTDEQVGAYYEENKANFMTEEKVKLAYLDLEQDTLAKGLEVNDELLKAYYDENPEHYQTPESRNVNHILIAANEGVKDEDAKQRADALYTEIGAGTRTFEDVAKTDSADKVSAESGGLLENVVRGDWDPEFEKAVFSLEVNQVSEPVKTEAGYEIIRVNSSNPAVQKPFDEVKAQVGDDYRRTEAGKLFLDRAEAMQTVAYEQSGDLAPAAKAAGLEVQETDWVTRAQGGGIAENPKVRETAFSDEVLKEGKNSELIQLSDTRAVVVRTVDQQPAAQKPLDEVRETIVSILKGQEARKLATQKGEDLLKQVTSTGWSALEAAGMGTPDKVDKPGKIGRVGSQVLPNIIEKAFSMGRPAEGKPGWDSVTLPNGDYVVVGLLSVEDGATTLEDGAGQVYSGSLGSRELGAVLKSLRERADIQLHPENI